MRRFLSTAFLLGLLWATGCSSAPFTADDYFREGLADYEDEDYTEAISDLSISLLMEDNLFARFLRASCYSVLGEDHKALTDLDACLRKMPDFEYALLARGIIYQKLGHRKAALEDFREYLAVAEGSPHFGEVERRIFAVEAEMRKKGPGPPPPDTRPPSIKAREEFEAGLDDVDAGQWKEAFIRFGRVLEIFPDHVQALYNRAFCRFRLGQPGEAIPDLERALTLKPYLARAHYLKAVCLEHVGKPEEATKSYEQYLFYQPGAPNTEQVRSRLERLKAGETLPPPELPETKRPAEEMKEPAKDEKPTESEDHRE